MKKQITVLGIEANGVRGIRLEQGGTGWKRTDAAFWPFAAAPAGEEDASGAAESETAPDDSYSRTVEAFAEAGKRFGTREIVLAAPLPKLLVKILRTSADADEAEKEESAVAQLDEVSPFPGENPVVGLETVAENDRETVSLAAALPEASAAEIGDALGEAGLRVVRTDITSLGWLRSLWPRIYTDGDVVRSRKLVLLDNLDLGWDAVVLDDGVPSVMRGFGGSASDEELVRETMLTLIRAGTAEAPAETVVFSKRDTDPQLAERLAAFGKVRWETVGADAADDGAECRYCGVEGVAMRTAEDASLDITPADWVEFRTEGRFRKRLTVFLAAAIAGWAVVMAALFGGPLVYGHLTDRQKAESKRHAPQYKAVKEMRDKAQLVQQYSDHARGSLEMLKAISDRLPAGVTLTSFNYRRGDKLTVSGEAQQPTDAYYFKDALAAAETEAGEDGTPDKLFEKVNLIGPSQVRGVHKFSIEIDFRNAEEE